MVGTDQQRGHATMSRGCSGLSAMRCVGAIGLLAAVLPFGPAFADESLSWRGCVALAAEHNPALRAAHAQLEAAEAGIGVARSSLLPQLSAGGSADRSNRNQGEGTSYGVSLSIEQSLYSGGRNIAGLRAARASHDQVAASATDTGAQVSVALRSAFIDVLHAEEQVRLLDGLRG